MMGIKVNEKNVAKKKSENIDLFPLNIDSIKSISKILHDENLHEISISQDGESLTIKLPRKGLAISQIPSAVDSYSVPNSKNSNVSLKHTYSGEVVKSPMVGTVYLAASPKSPKFINVGDKVKKGQTLMIIEAMKVMNQIESPKDGEIEKILVNDKDLVEFDHELIVLK